MSRIIIGSPSPRLSPVRPVQRPVLTWLLVLAIVLSALTPRMHGMDLPKWMTLGQGDVCTTQATARDKPAEGGGSRPASACVCLQCAVHTPAGVPPQTVAQALPQLAPNPVYQAHPTVQTWSAWVWPSSQPRAPPVLA